MQQETRKIDKIDAVRASAPTDPDLICSQDKLRAWIWSRQSDGASPKLPTELAGRDGGITLAGLGIELAMAAIFRGIPDALGP